MITRALLLVVLVFAAAQWMYSQPQSCETADTTTECEHSYSEVVGLLRKAPGRLHECLDPQNGLKYNCKYIKCPGPLCAELEDSTVDDVAPRYMPPYRAALPKLKVRIALDMYSMGPEDITLDLVPAKYVLHSRDLMSTWIGLAKSSQLFGCQRAVCDVLYEIRRKILDEALHEDSDRPRSISNINFPVIRPGGGHTDSTSEAKSTTEMSVSNLDNPDTDVLVLCSLIKTGNSVSRPFSCMEVAEVFPDHAVFIRVPTALTSIKDAHLAPQPGGTEGGEIPAGFVSLSVNQADPSSTARSLIRTALTAEPTYQVIDIPGGSLLALRSHVVDEIFHSIFGGATLYEDTTLRFDFVPTQSDVDVYITLFIDHSKYPDPSPEHWHPATSEEVAQYQNAIEARILKRLNVRFSCSQDEGTWQCRDHASAAKRRTH